MQLVTHSEHGRRIEELRRTATKTQPPAPLGVHHLLELYGWPIVVLNDTALLSHVIEHAAELSKTKLLRWLVQPVPAME